MIYTASSTSEEHMEPIEMKMAAELQLNLDQHAFTARETLINVNISLVGLLPTSHESFLCLYAYLVVSKASFLLLVI